MARLKLGRLRQTREASLRYVEAARRSYPPRPCTPAPTNQFYEPALLVSLLIVNAIACSAIFSASYQSRLCLVLDLTISHTLVLTSGSRLGAFHFMWSPAPFYFRVNVFLYSPILPSPRESTLTLNLLGSSKGNSSLSSFVIDATVW